MIPVSVCMIAKNEEQYIEKCLQYLTPHFQNLIVVDTGSADRTMEIARRYTEHVYSFTWADDFSAARNFSISKAACDWILVLDCDEFLEEVNVSALGSLMQNNPHGVGMILRKNPYFNHAQISDIPGILTERVARLFSKKEHQYQGRIHEQVVRIDGQSPSYFPIPLVCHHEGYRNQTIAAEKAKRNLALLLDELEQSGADPYTCFQIGKSYQVLRETEQACHYYEMGLSFDVNPQLEYVKTMVESYGYALLELKRYQEALSFEAIYEAFATRADFPFLMGLIYMNNGLFEQAVAEFEKAVTFHDYAVEGVNSYSACYNIGVIYECTGNRDLARSYYKKCGNFKPALRQLQKL